MLRLDGAELRLHRVSGMTIDALQMSPTGTSWRKWMSPPYASNVRATSILTPSTSCTHPSGDVTVATTKAFQMVEHITDLDDIRWLVSAAYGLSVGSDIMLAGILLYTLQPPVYTKRVED
ncbi:hypothetical protein GY45DRAFT_337875 [Cubamyces sp. BRFM 1775]|nr:hypothetical protein GY45DRAFT_337875 [Cubamyces sp. BRFM 1775]